MHNCQDFDVFQFCVHLSRVPCYRSLTFLFSQQEQASMTQVLPASMVHRKNTMGATPLGDLWMWLQLMWLQFEVVRGPLGVVRIDLVQVWGSNGPTPAPNPPQRTPTGPRTISDCNHMSCSHIHRSPNHMAPCEVETIFWAAGVCILHLRMEASTSIG